MVSSWSAPTGPRGRTAGPRRRGRTPRAPRGRDEVVPPDVGRESPQGVVAEGVVALDRVAGGDVVPVVAGQSGLQRDHPRRGRAVVGGAVADARERRACGPRGAGMPRGWLRAAPRGSRTRRGGRGRPGRGRGRTPPGSWRRAPPRSRTGPGPPSRWSRPRARNRSSRLPICVDRGQVLRDGREAELLGPGLVHEGAVEVADLAGRRARGGVGVGRGPLDDGADPLVGLLAQHVEGAVAAAVGGDLGVADPGAVGVAEQVVLGADCVVAVTGEDA